MRPYVLFNVTAPGQLDQCIEFRDTGHLLVLEH